MDDDREFADFVTARMPAVLRWAHLLTGDRGPAEGLVQHAVDVSTLQGGGSSIDGRELTLMFYELHRAGRVQLASVTWDGDNPTCVAVRDVTDQPGRVYGLVAHCTDPGRPGGALTYITAPGVRATSVHVDAGPGQHPYDQNFPDTGISRGPTSVGTGAEFPTGPGELRLVDAQGRDLPSAPIPAYRG